MVHKVATEVYAHNAVVVKAKMTSNSNSNSDYSILLSKEYSDNTSLSSLTMENINTIGNYHLIIIFEC